VKRATNRIVSRFENASRFLRSPLTVGVGFLTLARYLATAIGFVTTVTAARILGPQAYGRAALLMGYPLLVWSFASVKSLSVTTRYMAGFRSTGQLGELSAISKLGFGLDALTGLGAAFLIAGSASFVNENLFHVSTLAWLSILFGISFPFYSLLSTSFAVLSSCERLPWLAAIQVFDRFITFLLVVAALLMGFGISGVILATAAAQVIVGLMAAWLATLSLEREGVPAWWRADFGSIANLRRELRRFFGWNYLIVSFSGIVQQGPLLLLGYWRGPRVAGFYRLAMSIFSVSSHLEGSLWTVVYPRLSIRWGAGEREEVRRTLWRWSRLFGLPLALALLAAAALSPVLLPAVFGEEYGAMVPGAQFLIVGAAVSGLFFYLGPFYYAAGRFDAWAKAYGLYTVLVIGLTPIVIDRGGYPGVAALVGLGLAAFNICMAGLLAGTRFMSVPQAPKSAKVEGPDAT